MGCGISAERDVWDRRNAEIENQLIQDKVAQRNEIKILLLGE
jgi:hypothetical protein